MAWLGSRNRLQRPGQAISLALSTFGSSTAVGIGPALLFPATESRTNQNSCLQDEAALALTETPWLRRCRRSHPLRLAIPILIQRCCIFASSFGLDDCAPARLTDR
jgi:hypothetical protein